MPALQNAQVAIKKYARILKILLIILPLKVLLKKTVKGSFDHGSDIYMYSYYTRVIMENRDSGLYQVQYYYNKEKNARRFDVVIGSGTRGQSFASWDDNKLYQLPVSYLTSANAWANSPGYSNYEPNFYRRISAHCMECHSTYMKDISTPDKPEQFDPSQVIYGVQCESCHGPGEKHVEFQEQNPNDKTGRYIIDPATYTRQQKLDMCSYCHSNARTSGKPPFGFVPGDTLTNVVQQTDIKATAENIDVHGDQYGLLTASDCYKETTTLDCSSCHNTHQEERGELELFSNRCMNCHREEKGNFCKMTDLSVAVLKTNCIDCHMPKKSSKTLTLELENMSKNTAATLRSHLIAIYPSATQKYISTLKSQGH